MFVKAISHVSKATFPIFSWVQIQNQVTVGVSGTGFFINSSGYFVTAAHLFDTVKPNLTFRYWGNLPEQVTNPAVEIAEVAKDDANDIYIGRVPGVTGNKFLKLADWLPKIGKSVCISGYPLAEITANQAGFDLHNVRRYFQPSFVLDMAKVQNKANGKVRIHDGFLVRDVGLFGMSGGPIFDINGVVLGVQGSVSTRTSTNGQDNITVHNAAAIRSNLIVHLLKTNNVKYNR
ncbi:MAG: S1 family peptidase [Candidatus Doudnabacteria bacterium]